MEGSNAERIDRLFRRDTMLATGFVVVLWATVIYVFFMIAPLVEETAITVVLAIAGAAVLLFNTASITAMLRHYTHDKADIYGTDLRHQDALVEMKRAERHGRREVPA